MTIATSGCQTQPARRNAAPAVRIEDIQGYLEFVSRAREEEQKSRLDTGDTLSRERTFQENLQLEAMGYAYHPNLLEFSAAGLFGLLQHKFEETAPGFRQGGHDNGTLLGFDVTGHVLQKKNYPGTIYARREQGLEPRLFRSSVDVTASEYGVQWLYLSEKTPTSLRISHTDILIDPLETQEEDSSRKDTDYRFETGYNFSEYNTLSFLYEHEKVSERPNVLDYDSDEATLGHRLEFGDEKQHRLESELNYYNQEGTFNVERLRWRENLWLSHTDKLRSRYRFEAIDRTRGSLSNLPTIEERSYYFSGMLEHELYESLISQIHGVVQNQEFETGAEIDRYTIGGALDYRKSNRWGRLRGHYRVALEREKRGGGDVSAEVLDETHTFRDPEPITLNNPNIDTGSIVITAQDRATYYQLGSDYLVRRLGDEIEIERVVTGRIADGETVLIDYVFNLGGNFTLDTVSQNFLLRQDFDFGLSPYYRLRWQDQTISPQTATGAVAEDITAHTFGVEYRWRSFKLQGEYEDHDSTVNPFEAVRFNGAYSHRFKSGARGSLRGGWTRVSYGFPRERDTRYFSVEGRYRHPITRNLAFEGSVLYRNGRDTLSGNDEGVDLELAVEWFIRQTEIRISYDYKRFDDVFARTDSSMFYFQLKRRF